MKTPPRRACIPILLSIILTAIPVYGAGISTLDVSVDIGQINRGATYSMFERTGHPFRVNYDGTRMLNIAVSAEKPAAGNDGYEPIHDPSWIKIIKGSFTLAPGEEAQTDVLVKIPEDCAPGKYYAYLYPRQAENSIGGAGGSSIAVGVGLLCKLKFDVKNAGNVVTIGAGYPGNEWSVSMSPDIIYLKPSTAPASISIVNSSIYPMIINLKSINPAEAGMKAPTQQNAAIQGDIKYYKRLKVKKSISVAPESKTELPVAVKLPANTVPGSYFFMVKAEITKKGGKTKIARYFKVFAQKD